MTKKAIKSASELTIKETLTAASWMGLTMDNPKAKRPQLLQDFLAKLTDMECESCDGGKCGVGHQFAMDQPPFVDDSVSDEEEDPERREEPTLGNGTAGALDQIRIASHEQNPGLATTTSTGNLQHQAPPVNMSGSQGMMGQSGNNGQMPVNMMINQAMMGQAGNNGQMPVNMMSNQAMMGQPTNNPMMSGQTNMMNGGLPMNPMMANPMMCDLMMGSMMMSQMIA